MSAIEKVNDDNESYIQIKEDIIEAKEAIEETLEEFAGTIEEARQTKSQLTETIGTATSTKGTLDASVAAARVALEHAEDIVSGIEDIKDYLGYTSSNVVGIAVDYQNKTFKRLGGAYGRSAGSDFDVFRMFGGRKRCNVADDGTINAYYGDEDYTEDGTNGQVMVYQPKFYYRVVPVKVDKNTAGKGYH